MVKKLVFILALVSLSTLRPQPVAAADCGGPFPPAPAKVWAVSGPRAGEVTLHWDSAAYANRYAVAYGTVSGQYKYGADNIGGEKSLSYTVKYLSPGTKYYFKLAAARDCASSPFSGEFSAVARGGVGEAIPTTVNKPVSAVRTGAPVAAAVVKKPAATSKLWAVSGPKTGEVTLSWSSYDGADNYHLVYGTAVGNNQYGALNIGNINKFTVGKLSPGVAYYFALVPVSGSRAMYTTGAVKGLAKGYPVEIVVTSREALIQPKPVISQEQVSSPPAEIFGTPPPVATSAPVQEIVTTPVSTSTSAPVQEIVTTPVPTSSSVGY